MGVRNDWRVNGAAGLVAALEKGAAQTPVLARAAVELSADLMLAQTQMHISGRPGPEDATGDYRGSWTLADGDDGPDVVESLSVGSDAPQAHRLEFGFVGPDALGRLYDAPPYPHHGPARDTVEPIFYAAMEAVSRKATSW